MTEPGEANPPGEEPAPFIAGPPPPPPPSAPSPPPGSAGGSASGARGQHHRGLPAELTAVLKTMDHWSPWLVAPVAVLIAFAVSWLSSVLQSLRHAPGVHAQYRVFVFFSPGSVDWAMWILVGVAVFAWGRHLHGEAASTPQHRLISLGLMAAAAAVTVSAVIDILVELTNFGNGIDDAVSGLVSYLAALPIAAAAGWWANHLRQAAAEPPS
jgi:hypothetical protein